MTNPDNDRLNSAKRKAQNHFTASEQRDTLVRQEIEKERTALAARTAKLKALRLAKEAADKEAADLVPKMKNPTKTKGKAKA